MRALAFPDSQLNLILGEISNHVSLDPTEQGLFVLECSSRHRIPTISIEMGSHMFSLSPDAFTIDVGKDDLCILAMQSSGAPMIILGDVFLRQYVSVSIAFLLFLVVWY